MRSKIPSAVIEAIRSRCSIVEVVGAQVGLRRQGRGFVGICPFHEEKTPSFSVSEERGFFHCFGCGASGNVFTFLMKTENLTFVEAVRKLGERVGVEVPREESRGIAGSEEEAAFRLNEWAVRYFLRGLESPAGQLAREYLANRGIKPESWERFSIGFAPPNGGMLRALGEKKEWLRAGVSVGLLGRRQDGSLYERFRGRVMFPIRDTSGRVLGFGGRCLGNEQPKYLNSPESPVFQKSRLLYGLYEALAAVRKARKLILVEGYLDVVALSQGGIGEVVASLGTALGPGQVRLARRFAEELVAFFDGDRAGRDAAAKAFSTCIQCDVWGLAAFLPEGFDPDTFLRKFGAEETRKLIDAARPLAEFFLERNAPRQGATVPERTRAARNISEVLSLVKDPAQFDLLARAAAEKIGISEGVFRDARREQMPGGGEASRQRGAPEPKRATVPSEQAQPFVARVEELTLLDLAFLDRNAALLVEESGCLELFEDAEVAQAIAAAVEKWTHGEDPSSIMAILPERLSRRVCSGAMGLGYAVVDRAVAVRDCIDRIRARDLASRRRELRSQLHRLETEGDEAGYRTELKRMDEALRRRLQPVGAGRDS